jgi:anti-sigma28 factor (negative regulator of flagellin synthesis)
MACRFSQRQRKQWLLKHGVQSTERVVVLHGDRVARLRAQVRAGVYEIDNRVLVRKILALHRLFDNREYN